MYVSLEVKNEPRKDDLLFFNGSQWVAKPKEVLFAEMQAEINKLKEENQKLQNRFETLVKNIDDRLQTYHEILQNLTIKK